VARPGTPHGSIRPTWNAAPGQHVLACRARDEAGNAQTTEPRWNAGGYANNEVQRVPVTVTAR
jgi:sulfane dehydrogenase subunit SoxC